MDDESPSNLYFSLPIEIQSLILSYQRIPHFKELVSSSLYRKYSLYFRQFIREYDPTITIASSTTCVQQRFDPDELVCELLELSPDPATITGSPIAGLSTGVNADPPNIGLFIKIVRPQLNLSTTDRGSVDST